MKINNCGKKKKKVKKISEIFCSVKISCKFVKENQIQLIKHQLFIN
jgi:hypothetical protein